MISNIASLPFWRLGSSLRTYLWLLSHLVTWEEHQVCKVSSIYYPYGFKAFFIECLLQLNSILSGFYIKGWKLTTVEIPVLEIKYWNNLNGGPISPNVRKWVLILVDICKHPTCILDKIIRYSDAIQILGNSTTEKLWGIWTFDIPASRSPLHSHNLPTKRLLTYP